MIDTPEIIKDPTPEPTSIHSEKVTLSFTNLFQEALNTSNHDSIMLVNPLMKKEESTKLQSNKQSLKILDKVFFTI